MDAPMANDIIRILGMVDNRQISGDEAIRLVNALDGSNTSGFSGIRSSPNRQSDSQDSLDPGEKTVGRVASDGPGSTGRRREILTRLDQGIITTAQATALLAKLYAPV